MQVVDKLYPTNEVVDGGSFLAGRHLAEVSLEFDRGLPRRVVLYGDGFGLTDQRSRVISILCVGREALVHFLNRFFL